MYICEKCNAVLDDSSVIQVGGGAPSLLQRLGVLAGPKCNQGHYTIRVSFWLWFFTGTIFALGFSFAINLVLLMAGLRIPFLIIGAMAVIGIADMLKASKLSKLNRLNQARGIMRSGRGTGMIFGVMIALALYLYGVFSGAFMGGRFK
jgi:hypothetical protein